MQMLVLEIKLQWLGTKTFCIPINTVDIQKKKLDNKNMFTWLKNIYLTASRNSYLFTNVKPS